MSYTYSNEIKYADGFNLDAFGRLRTSNLTTLLDLKHTYDKQPLLVDEEILGGATSLWANSSVNMTVSSTGDAVIRQSIKSSPYQSGKSHLVEASFSQFQLQTNVIKRVGYYTSTTVSPFNSGFDGFFLESDGVNGEISFQIWRNGTNVLKSLSSSWLTTDYDVSLIDWTKTQLMMVDFQWLGVGRMRFSLVVDGIPRLFVANTAINNISLVYMENPNKPIRYEIRSTAGSGTFSQICSGVSMEGSINSLYKTIGIENFTERTLATAGTKYPLLGIRLVSGYLGVSGFIDSFDILQTTNDNFFITLEKNPTLSGAASWSSATGAPIQYSQGTGALTVSSPGYIIANYIGKASSLGSSDFQGFDSSVSLGYSIDGTPEEWWICITSASNTSKFRMSANVRYFQ